MNRSARIALAVLAVACLSWTGPARLAPAPPVSPPAPEIAEAAPAAPEDPAEVAAALARLRGYPTGLAEHELEPLARTIVAEATRNRLPVELLLAVMHVESRYQTFAVSPVGALGLMQVLPSTGQELAGQLGLAWEGPRTLFDPHANVALGAAYLRWLEDRYGERRVALAAYNWGPGRIDRRLRAGRGVPAKYASDVLRVYGRLIRS